MVRHDGQQHETEHGSRRDEPERAGQPAVARHLTFRSVVMRAFIVVNPADAIAGFRRSVTQISELFFKMTQHDVLNRECGGGD